MFEMEPSPQCHCALLLNQAKVINRTYLGVKIEDMVDFHSGGPWITTRELLCLVGTARWVAQA